MKGKNYANRKPENERPLNDFYPTPSCMVKELVKSGFFPGDKNIKIFDPCCGKGAICNVLRNYGYKNFVYEGLPKINVLDMQKHILRKGKTK